MTSKRVIFAVFLHASVLISEPIQTYLQNNPRTIGRLGLPPILEPGGEIESSLVDLLKTFRELRSHTAIDLNHVLNAFWSAPPIFYRDEMIKPIIESSPDYVAPVLNIERANEHLWQPSLLQTERGIVQGVVNEIDAVEFFIALPLFDLRRFYEFSGLNPMNSPFQPVVPIPPHIQEGVSELTHLHLTQAIRGQENLFFFIPFHIYLLQQTYFPHIVADSNGNSRFIEIFQKCTCDGEGINHSNRQPCPKIIELLRRYHQAMIRVAMAFLHLHQYHFDCLESLGVPIEEPDFYRMNLPPLLSIQVNTSIDPFFFSSVWGFEFRDNVLNHEFKSGWEPQNYDERREELPPLDKGGSPYVLPETPRDPRGYQPRPEMRRGGQRPREDNPRTSGYPLRQIPESSQDESYNNNPQRPESEDNGQETEPDREINDPTLSDSGESSGDVEQPQISEERRYPRTTDPRIPRGGSRQRLRFEDQYTNSEERRYPRTTDSRIPRGGRQRLRFEDQYTNKDTGN